MQNKLTEYPEEFAWAAAWTDSSSGPFILTHTIGDRKRIPMEHVGEMWAKPGETFQQGWKRAYRKGCRIIRVRVSPAFTLRAQEDR